MRKTVILMLLLCVFLSYASVAIACSEKQEAQESLDYNDPKTWFDESGKKIKRSEIDRIEEGMTLENVIKTIGKAKRDIGSGTMILEWDIDNGKTLVISFGSKQGQNKMDEWYVNLITIK